VQDKYKGASFMYKDKEWIKTPIKYLVKGAWSYFSGLRYEWKTLSGSLKVIWYQVERNLGQRGETRIALLDLK
jgi:hypothetical protein